MFSHRMAPSPIAADTLASSTPSENLDNDIQPLFILHKAPSWQKDRFSAGQGKLRKRNELSSPQSAKKQDGGVNEESDHHLFQQQQVEAFNCVWTKIESNIKVVLRGLNASVFNDIQRWVLECFNSTRLHGDPTLAEVRDLPTGMLGQLFERWEKLTADISDIHDKLKMFQSSARIEDGKTTHKSSKDISKRNASKVSLNIDNESRELNSQAVAFIDCLVRNYMRPIECMPFHEIFCFKNVVKLQSVLVGDPRTRIQVDLLESHKILRCSCCAKSGNAVLPSMHDSSIMYSLAQEHGDLINLHDWFQSFRTITLQQTNKRKQKSKQPPQPKKRNDTAGSGDQNVASIQARFCKAVTEMQITGLVRMPSKRRPDFVHKVVFGL